jgi:hypothetical protein
MGPEGDTLVTLRAPPSVRDGCPSDLSFDGWEPLDPLPEYNDDVTGYGLGSPSGNLVEEPDERLDLPVHFPDHPAFGPISSVGVPIPASPNMPPVGELVPASSQSKDRIRIENEFIFPQQEGSDITQRYEGEANLFGVRVAETDILDEFGDETHQSGELVGHIDPDFIFPKEKLGQSKVSFGRNESGLLFSTDSLDQSEPDSLELLYDFSFPKEKLGQSKVSLGQNEPSLSFSTDSPDQSEPDPLELLYDFSPVAETVAAVESSSPAISHSDRRRVNQRWFYEPRAVGAKSDAIVPALLPKRISKPPQRLTASRLGVMLCAPGVLVCSDSSSRASMSSSQVPGSTAGGRSSGTPAAQLSGLGLMGSLGQGGSLGPSRPPVSLSDGAFDLSRFSIRLNFPNGGAPTLVFSVYAEMPVSLLRLSIQTYIEVRQPVHLLVGESWEHDVLEHRGTITDRVFPGTTIPCPYLQSGSTVNVYLMRPEAEGLQTGSGLDAIGEELMSVEEMLAAGAAEELATEARYGPRFFESATGMRRGDPNPNHPDNWPLDSGRKTGERRKGRKGKTPRERPEYNLDDLLRYQLAEDALQAASSSSVAVPPRSRAAEQLSDREYSARRSRQEELFEGYRRIKRARTVHRSRDPEQEAISAPPARRSVFAGSTQTAGDLRREIREIRARMRVQWNDLNAQLREQADELRLLDPTREEKVVSLIPDDLLDSDEDDAESDSESEMVGDPPSFPPQGPFEPPDDGEPGLALGLIPRTPLIQIGDDFIGTPFLDGELGWCAVTAVGSCLGTPVVSYEPLSLPPTLVSRPSRRDYFSSESDVLDWCRRFASMTACDLHNWTVRLYGPHREPFTPHELVYGQRSTIPATKSAAPSRPCVVPPAPEAKSLLACPAVSGRNRPLRPVLLSPRQVRRVLAARETLFKFGTFVPRNDREANASPESHRWKAGRDLEWLRLNEQETFELDWDLDRVRKEYPSYKKADIGHCFYVYDYKYSGEHRVRLVFDGSRQSADTYSDTYAPTARQESVRLFHCFSVEESYSIGQYDVPQAFLKAFMDHVIFAYPPKGQSTFAGQLLKVKRALYGGKQSAYLWFQMVNDFLLELGFAASPLDQCFYKRHDAVLILYCDDLRIGASPSVLFSLHQALFDKFGVTTAPGTRFLGMDTHYDLEKGMLKISMETYITMMVERFEQFDLSAGVPFRELVGSLLWVTLCVMGPELLRVKDLARRCNSYTPDDYKQALKVMHRVSDRKNHGLIFSRGSAGKEVVPSSSRAPMPCVDSVSSDDIGLPIDGSQNEVGQKLLCKVLVPDSPLSPYAVPDPDGVDLDRVRLPVNPRYTITVYGDASFAIGEMKQSVSGFVIYLNGTPLLWGSLKQTIVVDSSCSAEFVAASIAVKQLLHAENMIGFLGFTCFKPYRMYTDSMACLHIATNPARLGNVRHLQIRYHLVRCYVTLGDVEMVYCVTEQMVADLFTKLVAGAQDERLTVRFYCLIPGFETFVLANDFKI